MIFDWKKYAIIALCLIAIGQFVFYKINSKDATEVELEYQEKIKAIEQIAREEASDEIKEITKEMNDTIQYYLKKNSQIKYKPYEKLIYVDRTRDTAIHVLNRARHLLQSQD
jgi:uncharacterized membrane protein YhiD involved in acid resistance